MTGGSGHLGAPIVRSVLHRGGLVVAIARGEDKLSRLNESCGSDSERLVNIIGDAREAEVIAGAIDAIDQRGHRLSGWVNNANTASGGGLLFSLDRVDLERAVVSLADLMMATEQVALAMKDRNESGSIVNISSMYGVVAPDPKVYADHPGFHNPPAYGAVKAGMIQFTRYAATHLAPFGIRVNSITPGPFPHREVQEHESFLRELKQRVPLGRIGRPEEVAGAVVYLLSESSSFTTGANIAVDGGWTAW